MGDTTWRAEPGNVVKFLDDLWLAVKFQSNSDIAGSPRNRFRPSLESKLPGGRALNMQWPHLGVLSVINLRMPGKLIQESVYGC